MKAEMLFFFLKKRSLKALDEKETLGKRLLELVLVGFCVWVFFPLLKKEHNCMSKIKKKNKQPRTNA